ncbi:MAG TPA: heavy-metal-associated domain-containing protein [Bacteroidales bacterium]|nr:heavy-metal-associated domain-containing protein [Bacteroidales bacterium]HRZ48875.1 heavy-metal-associated domain-containing protein [Bacteroidales bacterium]
MKKSAIVLTLIMGLFLSAFQLEAAKPDLKTVKFSVNMHCASCQQKIMENLPFEKGVKEVKADLATKIVEVTYDAKKTDPEKIKAAIQKLGYEVKTPEEASANANQPEHKCTGQKEEGHKCQKEGADAKQEHKCTGQKDAKTGDAEHKCTGQKDDAKTGDAEHKCTGQKDDKSGSAEHKCTGEKKADGTTEPHKCNHEKK